MRLSPRGLLGARFAAAAAQLWADTPYSVELVTQDVVMSDRHRRLFDDYSGDLSGRWIEAAALAGHHGVPGDPGKLDAVVRRVLATQRSGGGFGLERPAAATDHGMAWGNGRLLSGLLTLAEHGPKRLRSSARSAARPLAEHLEESVPRWTAWLADGGNGELKFALDCLSALEPLARMQRAGDRRARLAAQRLAAAAGSAYGPHHMHGHLLAQRGALELAAAVGDREAIEAIEDRWREVHDRHLLHHGGVPESLRMPREANTETCGIADWVMLSVRLNEVTGESHYLDAAERSLYNALLHAQRPSGHFGCETLCDDPGLLTFDYAPEAWWCCTFHGIRALHEVAASAVRGRADGVEVALLVDGDAQVEAGGVPVSVRVRTRYPHEGLAVLELEAEVPAEIELRVRVPGVALLGRLAVDGRPVEPVVERSFAVVPVAVGPRQTRVELELELPVSLLSGGTQAFSPHGNSTDAVGLLSERPASILAGPLVLAADAAHNPLEDVLRARAFVIRAAGDRFELDGPRPSVTALGHDTFRAPLVLAPLCDQQSYDADVTSRYVFARAHVEGAGVARRLVSDPPPAAIHAEGEGR
jgi:hypothetical protein